MYLHYCLYVVSIILILKKSSSGSSGNFHFFISQPAANLANFICGQFSKLDRCTYTGVSCSNRRGTHRRILLLFFNSIFAPFTALKFSFDKNIMQTKIAPFKGYSCFILSSAAVVVFQYLLTVLRSIFRSFIQSTFLPFG